MITTKIETERLILRALSENDAQDLYNIFSDHQVMKYWNCAPWDGLDVATQFIKTSRESMNNNKELTLGIYLKDSGKLLGKIMLFNLEQESRRAEIGFGISRNFWGKGVVFEAASAVVEYAFNSLELRRIEAEIDPLNVASGNALERLGFVKEGLLRQRWEIGGVISDSALFGLLAGEHRTQSG
ncbi:putative Acyl-CoA N-acyltransferase [Vibrio nigripulchritudo SFn27]|uniref:Putative Acyl-CoA N-acyltransferase n=1 Tax=Vibrio nigripulchritudo TaxID=28173 RepID=U4KBR9_9VIBR|nr:GNAT family N-acetyltransferase [Vibrio nigripulchritudo]CCN84185.1 putative Acyl-CoA N-acyltransferase [Vibrio nigripulchritudo BLFn1]CCN87100.1 putative Acyl-CoA N-acyltransferase [Vibrio nigripulchritudo SFn27]CCN93195.1 putative Acyl-CoA N-acyltransferase [Vibrio nigripulchritudo ENn2]CCO39652.1 putative Acyl-CoA N-acyltransferase [Vibrio nigripulchritudo SFn135]CCO54357.1 putative Acyl-CoA N-acyltransferase [Vibrio nigripulchritudo Wn13]